MAQVFKTALNDATLEFRASECFAAHGFLLCGYGFGIVELASTNVGLWYFKPILVQAG